jgi:ribosomal protein L21
MCLLVHAQITKISGLVQDENGNPIPYATIKLKGKQAGVAANQLGAFEIQAGLNDVLIISTAGFQTLEVPISGKQLVKISLKENKQLDEVIITAQGIRKKSREIGYAYTKLSNEDVNTGRSPQLGQALSGKVSGLAVYNINNSVDPQVKIVLRGYRSLTGNYLYGFVCSQPK